MLKKIIIGFAVVLAGLLVFAATRPDSFRIERTIVIKAPAAKIFPLINDLRNWGPWSPYEKKDPAMKRTFTGAAAGKGAVYEFEGNREVGKGRVVILNSYPPTRIFMELTMLKPLEAHNDITFTLKPEDGATRVTWMMTGPSPLIAKIMHIFFNVDRMVGADFETGLANLKKLSEK